MAEYELFGKTLQIPDSYIRKYNMNTRGWEASEAAEKEFHEWYKNCIGIDGVLKGYYEIASMLLQKYVVNRLFKQLVNLDIYDVSEDMYIGKVIDFQKIDAAYDYIESELEEIVEDKNEMVQYRAARKAARGRFVGGGFGLSGTIKGSLQAGALNATTGLAHSAVNTIGNIGSAMGASLKKSTLYNKETRETLNTGIYLAIGQAYENHMQLVNSRISGYYESGFETSRAIALFENAKKIPAKREELLFQAVQCSPEEKFLAYIFVNYPNERKTVYEIGKRFEIKFDKYIEEVFAKSYARVGKSDPDKVKKLKSDIIKNMKEYGIRTSETLTRIDRDMLVDIMQTYIRDSIKPGVNDKVLENFLKYDAPIDQKAKVVHEYGVWELAKKFRVNFSVEEKEQILKRYYTGYARKYEDEALRVKKKLQEIMREISYNDSSTFNQIEKDCLKRLCGDINTASEEQCNLLKQQVKEYDALEKNKKEFLDAIQARIETIWSKEDGEIFENVYMNTNIYDQTQVQKAIDFIKQKGRTSNSKKYIAALENCNPKNISRAKKYKESRATVYNIIGIVLAAIGIICLFLASPAAVVVIPGVLLILDYCAKKRMWKILTIDGTKVHTMLLSEDSSINTSNYKEPNSKDLLNKTDTNQSTADNIEVEDVREEAERKVEEFSRTFQGVTYASVEAMNAAKKEFEEREILRKKYDRLALISMILGIVGIPLLFTGIFWIPVFICGVVFGMRALIKKTQKKGFAITGLVLAGIALSFLIMAIAMPDDSSNGSGLSKEDQRYFEIVQMINDGKYTEAETNIQMDYGKKSYKGVDGWNKANLQRLLYHKQEKWDDEMQIILNYLTENSDFKDEIARGDGGISGYSVMVSCASKILDQVSPQNKQKAIDLIGEDLLNGDK